MPRRMPRAERAIALAAILLASASSGHAQEPSPADRALYETLARETQQAFARGTFAAQQERFAPAFLAQVPMESMNRIPSQYESRFGQVEGVRFVGVRDDTGGFGPGTAFFHVRLADGKRAILRIKLDGRRRIIAWHLGPPFEPHVDREDVLQRLRGLPGTVSACVRLAGDDGMLFSLAPDTILAVGSTFKLYVLGELLLQVSANTHELDEVVRLEDAQRSIGSGTLQRWPAGAPLTLQTLATLMISVSDNTATDLLLEQLGRRSLERHLGDPLPCTQPARLRPFLKTRELFLLQAQRAPFDSLRDVWLRGDTSQRRQVLERLAAESRDGIPEEIVPKGNLYDRLEWLVSARDLTRLMEWLVTPHAGVPADLTATARDILAINPGIPDTERDGRIVWMGYKGGSEPGVLNLTQAVETRNGKLLLLSVTWNAPEGVEFQRLMDLFRDLRSFAVDQVLPAPQR